MTFTRQQVFQACQSGAPQFGLDPLLIYAICLQEGEKDGTTGYDPSVARLEQGYYRRYTEELSYATTTEVILAASYGVMQTMGGSLREDGFFQWFFDQAEPGLKTVIKGPMTPFAVVAAINEYCVQIEWQIHWGCVHFKKKLAGAGGDIPKALLRWNGGTAPLYDDEVLAKYEKVKSGYR